MRSIVLLAILLVGGSAITACTVPPKVKYLTDTTSGREGITMFHLVDGSIVISQASDTKENTRVPVLTTKNDVPISDVSVTVIPKEYSTHLYGIVPQSRYLGTVDTIISSTFYDNSRVVHKLGVEVVDNRLKIIEAIGAIAGAAATFTLMDAGRLRAEPLIAVPVVLNPSDEADDKWHPLPSNEAWAYRIETKAGNEKDAVLAEGFFKEYDLNGWFNATSAFPISSCKEVRLELSTIPTDKLLPPPSSKRTKAELQAIIAMIATDLAASANNRIFVLKVPEPKKVRTIGMPPNGEITTHTLCGANTASQPSSAASTYDVLSALMKQAQAIYEAQKTKQE